MPSIRIAAATENDTSLILSFIRQLAEYERMAELCVATEEGVRSSLFGTHPAAEVIIAYLDEKPVGFALFFHSFSTFLAQRGLYLEDLFVIPEARGHRVGYALLSALANIAVSRSCGRMEWAVLKWNQLAIDFYLGLGAMPLDGWETYRLTGEPLQKLARSNPSHGA
ncbi:MAG TPA: GNAT family N-acetyltransferase [Gemmatimonadaceae bacterium]|nr:GNAT family N-acetyltransferase [Gemmatimonadaceae bacterium]